jgi:integrase
MALKVIDKLSALEVRNLLKAGKRGFYNDGGGLYLRVLSTVSASWIYRYDGRDMGLGSAFTVGLAEAREAARKEHQIRREGKDPIRQRQIAEAKARVAAGRALTFAQCAAAFIEANQAAWNGPNTKNNFAGRLRIHAFPIFGNLPVNEVDVDHVLKALEPIWQKLPRTANDLRSHIERILDWAASRGLRERGFNPARWKGHLEYTLPAFSRIWKIEHRAALPYSEIPAFMTKLRQRPGVVARALEFMILTAARPIEAIGVPWSEIDRDQEIWIVPGERMKSGRTHHVPLSTSALAIIDQMEAATAGGMAQTAKQKRILDVVKAHPNGLHDEGGFLSQETIAKLAGVSLGYVCVTLQKFKKPHEKGEYVFPSPRPSHGHGHMARQVFAKNCLVPMSQENVDPHGFRATFSTWAHEETAFPRELIEAALAHKVGDDAEIAYRRGTWLEKRRELMEAWANYCAGAAASATVVSLVKRRSEG